MANLPADLPEDWTSNQKISPNGTEVGLSEQHGYNYLMKQVNDAQTEINNIGTTIEEALTDVAKEASVQDVITSIGETDDTGGSTTAGTVMAKLNKNLSQNESNSADLELIKQILGSGSQEWQEPGTYSFQVPVGITKLTITACGGGGGGAGGQTIYSSDKGSGGGGGGAAAVNNQQYIVTAGQSIQITVGSGGNGGVAGKNGADGTATVIDEIVTLAGGKGGVYVRDGNGIGGTAGGNGGGAGGNGIFFSNVGNSDSLLGNAQNGSQGIIGIGGTGGPVSDYSIDRYNKKDGGGGGGGSLGNGGNGAGNIKRDSSTATRPTAGNRGGGGGAGAAIGSASSLFLGGAKGGNGYVRIEWGL